LSHGQALHLARQISESIARERLAQKQAPDTDEPMRYVVPASNAVLEAPVKEVPTEDKGAPSEEVGAACEIEHRLRHGLRDHGAFGDGRPP
jgi:hypothetical protein